MNEIVTIGVIGSIASIIGLLTQGKDWKSRVVHALYFFFIAVLSSGFVFYKTTLSEVTKIERQAEQLLESASELRTDGDRRGFILATMAFLEKNKNQYPETFSIAKDTVQALGVNRSEESSGVERLYQEWRLEDGADTMRSLLKGIAVGAGT